MKCSSCAARFIAPKSQPSAPTNPNTDVPADFLPRSPLTADEPATGSNPEVTQAKESNLSRGKVQRRPLELARSESSTSSSEPDLPPPPGSYSENRYRPQTGTRSSKSSGNWFLSGLFLLLAWPLAVAMFFIIFGPNKETGHYLWIGMLGLFSFFLFAMASSNARKESLDLLHWLILLSILPAALVGYYTAKVIYGNKVVEIVPKFLQNEESKYRKRLVEIKWTELEAEALKSLLNTDLEAQQHGSYTHSLDKLIKAMQGIEPYNPYNREKSLSELISEQRQPRNPFIQFIEGDEGERKSSVTNPTDQNSNEVWKMHNEYVNSLLLVKAMMDKAYELDVRLMKLNKSAQDTSAQLSLPLTQVQRIQLSRQLLETNNAKKTILEAIEEAKEEAEMLSLKHGQAKAKLHAWFEKNK